MQLKYYTDFKKRNPYRDESHQIELENLNEQLKDKIYDGLSDKLQALKIENTETSIEEYKKLKAKLPCIQVHNANYYKDSFVSTEIICFDLDNITSKEVLELKAFLSDKNVYAFMISPSGLGLKVFLNVYGLTSENFKMVYETLAIRYANALNSHFNTDKYTYAKGVFDSTSNDLNRFCYFINPIEIIDSTSLHVAGNCYTADEELTDENVKAYEKRQNSITQNVDYKQVQFCVNQLVEKKIQIASRYKDLYNIICAFSYLVCEKGVDKSLVFEALQTVLSINQKNEEYFVTSTNNSYHIKEHIKYIYDKYKFTDKSITIGTFFKYCKDNNISFRRLINIDATPTKEIVSNFLSDNDLTPYSCKYSKNQLILKNDIYTTDSNTNLVHQYVNLNDTKYDVLKSVYDSKTQKFESQTLYGVRLEKHRKIPKIDFESSVNLITDENVVDTSKLLFEKLVSEYSNLEMTEYQRFVNIFKENCDGNKDLTERKIKTALNSVIHKSLGHKTEWCVTLVSKQGIGKTTFIRELFKVFDENKLMGSLVITTDEWKTDEMLSHYIISEIDEKSVGQNDTNIIKRIVSLESTNSKAKHSNLNVKRINRSTIIFTSNDYKYLKNSEEENRRFLTFDVVKPLWGKDENNLLYSKFKDVDFRKVWAELYNDYLKNGLKSDVEFNEIIEDNVKFKEGISYDNRNNLVLKTIIKDILDDKGVEVYLTIHELLGVLKLAENENIRIEKTEINKVTEHFKNLERKQTRGARFVDDNKLFFTQEMKDELFNTDFKITDSNSPSPRYKFKLNRNIIVEHCTKVEVSLNDYFL